MAIDQYVITLELGYGIPSFFDRTGIRFKSVLLKVTDLPASFIYTREEAERAAAEVQDLYPYAVVEVHNCAWIDVENLERKHRIGTLAAQVDEQYAEGDDCNEQPKPLLAHPDRPERHAHSRRTQPRKNYHVERVVRRSIKDPETGTVTQSARLKIVRQRKTYWED